jgi:nucleoside-diphosphate-sugar epimerase
MNILVTGGAGFLGSECIRQLRAAGHETISADRQKSADITIDLADAEAVARLPNVDVVVHAAAVQYVSDDLPWMNRRSYFFRNNVTATTNLVRRYSGSGTHFVNVGTSMMYEQSGRAAYDTDAPFKPQGVYTASKIEAQRLIETMPDPTACIIPCIIAGAGRGGLFDPFVRTIVRYRIALCPGRGDHRVDLVHVSDAASLIARVVNARATGRFNAASAEPLSFVDWMGEIAAELKVTRPKIVRLPLAPIEFLAALSGYRLLAREQVLMLRGAHVLSLAQSEAIGWTPQWTNAAIVRETARAIARRLA